MRRTSVFPTPRNPHPTTAISWGPRVRAMLTGLLAGALLATSAGPASAAAESDGHGAGLHKVAYFIQWGIYARQYFVRNVAESGQAAGLTTINYAFGGVSQAGTCTSLKSTSACPSWSS